MNFKDITVGIVTFKSEKVIFKCLKSLENIKKIIILDNSNDLILKKKLKNFIHILSSFYRKKTMAMVLEIIKFLS